VMAAPGSGGRLVALPLAWLAGVAVPSAPSLDAVRPRIAVFQAGYRNRFGHPAADVLDRYRERAIAIVASPACGAWQWRAEAAAEGTCERDASRRYWHHRP